MFGGGCEGVVQQKTIVDRKLARPGITARFRVKAVGVAASSDATGGVDAAGGGRC